MRQGLAFPSSTFQSTNYWVDVVFTTTAPADTTPPTVTGFTPASGATNVGITTTVTATFSESVDASTVNSSTFTLRNAAGPVPANVGYNASTRVATLTPSALARAVDDVHGDGARRGDRSAREGSGRQRARGEHDLVVHDRGAGHHAADGDERSRPQPAATGVARHRQRHRDLQRSHERGDDQRQHGLPARAVRRDGAADVTYNATNRQVTLNPNANLAALTTYTATMKGGASDPRVKDVAGNALAADRTWTFTTR